MSALPHRPWPADEDYRYLAAVGPAGLAWEWLRRDPDYRRLVPSAGFRTSTGPTVIAATTSEHEARWGCLHVEDPARTSAQTNIVWSADIDPSVLRVEAVPACRAVGSSLFDLDQWAAHARLVKRAGGDEYLLLACGGQHVRLDIFAGTLLDGPAVLRHDIGGPGGIDVTITALRRFYHLCRFGAFPPARPPRNRTQDRAVVALRVHDVLVQGASIRDVGIMLFGAARVETEWLAPGESLKSSCRRIIGLARDLAAGGYRDLLR